MYPLQEKQNSVLRSRTGENRNRSTQIYFYHRRGSNFHFYRDSAVFVPENARKNALEHGSASEKQQKDFFTVSAENH